MAKFAGDTGIIALCETMGLKPSYVRRLVIYFQYREVAKIYVEMLMDTKELKVLQTLEGIEIITTEKADVPNG